MTDATAAPILRPIRLPRPYSEADGDLMQALRLRKSSREFSPRPLPDDILSTLLWAAFGVNRSVTGGRTAL